MPTTTEKFLSLIQHIWFREIGTKLRTNMFKIFFDKLFVIFEKAGSKFDIISNNYLKMYDEIVEKEIKMANVSMKDSVLVIGCGPLPATSALVSLKTRANIVSVDNDSIAVKEASKYIKKLNLEKLIQIEHADGFNYSLEKFNLIFVLYGINDPKKILELIAKKMNKDARVVFRTTIDFQGKTLGETFNLSDHFIIKNCVRSESMGSVDSFLLLKKNL